MPGASLVSSRPHLHPVWGHEALRVLLGRTALQGRLPSALLLHGPRGTGKQRLALWMGQLILCEATTEGSSARRRVPEPCGTCHACRLVLGLQHPDLHWHFALERPRGVSGDRLSDALERARAERLEDQRIQSIRYVGPEVRSGPSGIYLAAVQTIRRQAQSRPSMGPEQVFVIGEAEELVPQEASQEAANALLKLLEEPPRDTRMILTSSEPGRLLPTVRSRTVPLHVGRLPNERVQQFLEEQAGTEPADAQSAARLGAGSIGRALGFLPVEGGAGPLERTRRSALELLQVALSPRREEAFAFALSFPPSGARHLAELLDFLGLASRDLAALAAGAAEDVSNPDAAELFGRATSGGGVHAANAVRTLAAVERARVLARGNVNPQLLVTGLIEELRHILLGEPGPEGALP